MAYLYLISAFVLNSLANILLKIQAGRGLYLEGINFSLITKNIILISSLTAFALNFFFYFLALRSVPISVAYPIMIVITFVLVNSTAYFLLNENINLMQLSGYALILIGLSLVFIFQK